MRKEALQLACYLQKLKFFQQFQGVSEVSTHVAKVEDLLPVKLCTITI